MKWTVSELVKHAQSSSVERNGNWLPVRPLNYQFDSRIARVRLAWAVLTGKADAVFWEGDRQ